MQCVPAHIDEDISSSSLWQIKERVTLFIQHNVCIHIGTCYNAYSVRVTVTDITFASQYWTLDTMSFAGAASNLYNNISGPTFITLQ